MEISSCKIQERGSFSSVKSPSCSVGSAVSSLAFIISTVISMILLHIVFTGTLVDSGYKLSKDCTRITLSGRKLTVAEGQPFSFYLKAYNIDCDKEGCKSYYGSVLVCDSNPVCQSCSIYTGPFSSNRIQLGIWLLSDIYTRAPGATCMISGTPTAPLVGSYPVSCVIKNTHASDVYQYLLRVVVLDESNPNDLGNPADLQSMIDLGATIKVVAGVIDPQSSSMYWANKLSEYYAGDKLELTVALKDQFGNAVSEKTGRSDLDYPWNVTVVDLRTNIASYPSFDVVIDRDGYHNISFVANQVGPQSVFISNNGRTVGGYSLPFTVKTGTLYLPLCRGSWVDNKHTFIAGTTAKFRLTVVDKTNAPLGSTNLLYVVFNIFDEAGKRNLGTNIQMHSEDELGYVLMEFQTTKAGRYYVYIGNNTFYVPGSPFPYDVVVGSVSIPACKGVLMQEDAFKAGSTVVLNITLFDCCGNLVTRLSYVEFSVSLSFYGNKVSSPAIVKGLDQSTGYQTISFYPTLSGKYSMSVGFKRESILNSPFTFTVLPGPFSVELSTVTGFGDFSSALAGLPFNVKVQQRDEYGNAFTTEVMYNFRVTAYELVDGKQNLVVPWVSTIYDAKSGVQSMNIVLYRAGSYYLEIGSLSGNISGSPFNIIIKAGTLNVSACIGSWVSKSIIAGSAAQFKVLLMDSFGNKVTSATGKGELIYWRANVTWSQAFNKSIVDGNSTAGLESIDFKVVSSIDVGVVNINFNITIAGEYNLHIAGFSSGRFIPLGGSPFYFRVNADSILPATSSFTWLHNPLYTAGDKALGTLLLMDRFNNSVFVSQKGTNPFQIKIVQVLEFEAINFLDTKITQTLKGSTLTVSFPTTVSGNFQLLITDSIGSSIEGSPFAFSVVPGTVVIKNCVGQWQNATPQVEEGSLAQFLVMERDAFDNVVCRNISNGEKQLVFQAKVMGLEEVHVLDLEFKPVKGEANGTVCGQLVTFLVFYNLGRFRLEIKSSNQSILGSPYFFTVVEGPVSGSLSTFEGPGLEISNAGKPTYYVMRLRDNRGAPKGFHVNSLSVQIFIFGGTIQIKPVIVAVPNNLGVFNVSYLPATSGNYVILTRWIGVQLGETRYMTVNPGPVSISNCSGKWATDIVNVQTGQIAKFIITQRDIYGNEVLSKNSSDAASFTAKFFKMGRTQTIYASILSIELWGERPTKNQLLSFQIWEIGSLLLQIQSKGTNINESPFPFTCTEGPVALPECSGEWQDGKHAFSVGDTAKFIIYCTQDVSITNLSFNPSKFQSTVWDESFRFLVNTSNLRIEKMVTETMGSQLLRFSLNKSGNFWLSVKNMVKNLTGSPFKFSYNEGPISMEYCTGKWQMGLNLFEVGSPAFFVVRQSDEYGNPVYEADPLTIKVTQRNAGIPVTLLNVSGQALFTNRTEYRLVSFALKEVGDFNLHVGNSSLEIFDSPFAFSYIVGLPVVENTLVVGEGLSPLASVNFWNEIIVYIRDLYENIVPNSNVTLSLSSSGAENVQIEGFKPGMGGGFLAVYKPLLTGQYNISIFFNGLPLPKSPFHVNVGAGWVQAKFCTAIIKPSSTVVAGDKFRVYVMARDLQGNSVSYLTQAMKFLVTPLPLGIASSESANAQIYDYALGVYFVSFSIAVVGTFKVEIDAYGSYINGSAYTLAVIPGPVSPQHCVIHASARAHAGSIILVKVQARDVLQNIVNKTLSGTKTEQFLANFRGPETKTFYFFYIGNGVHQSNLSSNSSGNFNLTISYGGKAVNNNSISIYVSASAIDPLKCFYTMSINERVLVGTYGVLTIIAKDFYGNDCTSGGGGFKVSFINIKASEVYSGTPYDNNNGNYMFPFQLEVAGTYQINITYNGVQVIGQEQIVVLRGSTEAVSISYITPTLVPTENYTTLNMFGDNLMQIISFSCIFGDFEKRPGRFNTSQESLHCDTPYIKESLTVRLTVQLTLYQGKSTFNFDITFYVDRPPIANEDRIWSWKNSFVSFSPLLNDQVAYGSPNLLGVCQDPKSGAVEVVGSSLRYTPKKNFTGSDKLTYTISDFRGLIAHGDVILSVYALAPQIVSSPQVLVALEDQSIPSKGGIQGLEIANPNIAEIVTVEVQAGKGHLKFAEDSTYLWQGVHILSYDTLDESKPNSTKSSLKFTGTFTLVSSALQALRYQGEAYFNGNDFIKLDIYNKRLEGSSRDILVMLKAKNDPPFINASALVFLNASYWKAVSAIPIEDISVGDPDQRDVQGFEEHFAHHYCQ